MKKGFLGLGKIMILAALLLFAAAPSVHANLLQDSSFELNNGSWAFVNVDWWTGWTAKDGTVSIDVSGLGAGWISQTFATNNNQQYQVTFWLAGNPAGPPDVKNLLVSAGDVINRLFTFDTTNSIYTNMGWTEESFSFTAQAASTTLLFQSSDNTAYGPAIDLVSVDPAAVPVPAPLWLFGSGLLGMAGLRRKFKS